MTLPGDLPDWLVHVIGTSDQVLLIQGLLAGGLSNTINVSQYNSVVITTGGTPQTAAQVLAIAWFDVNGIQIASDVITAPADGIGVIIPDATLPVRGTSMNVSNQGSQAETITILGSGRTVPGLVGVGYRDVCDFTTGNIPMTVNGIFELGGTYISSQGWHQFDIGVTSTAVSGELLVMAVDNAVSQRDIRIADTVTMHVDGTSFRQYGQVILPASAARFRWVSRTAATYAVTVQLIALGR